MYDFFRRYNKQLMAVFGVVLMIAFLMPNFQQASRGRADRVIGNIGETPVYQEQVHEAQQEWEFLATRVAYHAQQSGATQWQSILALMPPSLSGAIQENPATYFLLQE